MMKIVAMGVYNPDRSPVEINRRDAAPTPTGFTKVVSDDFPVLHVMPNVAPFRRTAWLSFTFFSA